ncbi:MAG: alpha/beta fold hydrolase [Acidimicrobiales bacterium]
MGVGAWRDAGAFHEVGGHQVYVRDEPARDPDPSLPPLLVLHGFPTNSFDFVHVLPALAERRRVVLPDFVGFGLSAKPDHRYGIRSAADTIEGVAAALGLAELDLLSHDMGDSVAGELLARDLDGSLGFTVRRRVLTNGSIYLELAQLTTGQQLLLSLPDEAVQISDQERYTESLAATCAPEHRPPATDLAAQWELLTHNGGDRLLARTIRYIEDRRAEERRYTGAIEAHPSPLGIVWGELDPIAVHTMTDRLLAARPDATRTTLTGVGHYPMVETPDRFAAAVLASLDGASAPATG